MKQTTTLDVGDLLLVGGGHTHALFLRRLAMHPIPGLRVTLISDVSHAPYSGMVHGIISNRYRFDDGHIDLRRLCTMAGAHFVQARLASVDRAERHILLKERPPIPFDLLSLNTGSVPAIADVPGAAEHAIPAKPIAALLAGWDKVVANLDKAPQQYAITIVGGGPGGVEMALAMHARLGPKAVIHLIQREPRLLPDHPPSAGRRLAALLAQRDIKLHTDTTIVQVEPTTVKLDHGPWIPSNATFWVTHAAPPAWIDASGLAPDEAGFVRVGATLQTVTDDRIFAVGDVAGIDGAPRAKSGVHAVRQAPVLYANLRAAWEGTAMKKHRPQRHCLSLISTADESALGSRGRWVAASPLLWRAKDFIDRRFIRRFAALSEHPGVPDPSPPGGLWQSLAGPPRVTRCLGCGAKLPSRLLHDVLRAPADTGAPHEHPPTIDLGLDRWEDGAALRVNDDTLLIQSVDHLPALIDDLYLFGRIAVVHAFSDILAMGGSPHSALATIVVPTATTSIMTRRFEQMMHGVRDALKALDATLIAGHSIEGETAAIGITANGTAVPGTLLTKGGMQPDDALILTKPLGIGVLFASAMQGRTRGRWIDAAIDAMLRSNASAAKILRQHGATACTDVTGFGLAGHLLEMAEASRCVALLELGDIPWLPGALDAPVRSSLFEGNRDAATHMQMAAGLGGFADHSDDPGTAPQRALALLFDPQTSGGLLATVPANRSPACLTALHAAGDDQAACIGFVRKGEADAKPIEVQ